MENWDNLPQERKNKYLRMKSNLELSQIFNKPESFFDKQKEGNWDALETEKQYSLLETMRSDQLSETFGKTENFFIEAKKFMDIYKTKSNPETIEHHIPKRRMILSARRDLDFVGALCELIDNSIDGWILNNCTGELNINMNFNPDQGKGYYYDNAGGLSKENVFRVFIPGATIEGEKTTVKTIGSFAMGAKKAIFHVSDGTTIFSAKQKEKTYYASIPEGWENIEKWTTFEGESSFKIGLFSEERPLSGETFILFERLLDCPVDDIDRIKKSLGKIYAELIKGKRAKPKLNIKINNEKIVPNDIVIWANPKGGGVEPRRYIFSKRMPDIGAELNEVEITFELVIGLKTGKKPEMGFGIDVYGNNRLYDENKTLEVGYGGKRGIAITRESSRLIKGKLFIHGPSEGIPWDTHKRKYIDEHPVAQYLRDCFDDIYRAYFKIAGDIGQGTGITDYLAGREYVGEISEIITVNLGLIKDRTPKWKKDQLPKWEREEETSEEDEPEESGNGDTDIEEDIGEDVEESEEELENKLEIRIEDFKETEIETIEKRIGKELNSPIEIKPLIESIAKETTVIISFSEIEYKLVCDALQCSDTTMLAEKIKEALMNRIKS